MDSLFSRYTLNIQAKNIKPVVRLECSTEMPEVVSGEHGPFNPLVVALQLTLLNCILLQENCYRYLSSSFGKKLLRCLSTTLQYNGGRIEILRQL